MDAATPIRFAVSDCPLGTVLVAVSDRGLRFVLLGDTAEELLAELKARLPSAPLVAADANCLELLAQVAALCGNPRLAPDLPLDLCGTPFQQRVWQALRQIPPGATESYGDIAHRIGAPRGARAVARACAANPLAVVIPCHRVLRADGGLSGYRWGVERKRALLHLEKTAGLAEPGQLQPGKTN